MIKSTLGPKPEAKKEDEYPVLKEHSSGAGVVLFTRKAEGFIVHCAPIWYNYKMGYYSTGWDESQFTPCDYPITLENV